MQKQIYSGVNRIEIACNQGTDFENKFCDKLKSKVSEKLGLRTSIIAPASSSGQKKLGVIIITPEFDGAPVARIRLFWKNPIPVGAQPLQFTSAWYTITHETPDFDQITSRLLDEIP